MTEFIVISAAVILAFTIGYNCPRDVETPQTTETHCERTE